MLPPPSAGERRSFAVSTSILGSRLQRPAGSFGTAHMEGVMHAIDAQATRVDVTLTRTGSTVTDAGHGVADRAQIEADFKVVGFDHTAPAEADKRAYGEFGLGRGQQWNWASTVWRTRTFEMHVDIRTHGLDDTLHEGLEDQPGTVINGTFSTPITTPEVLDHTRQRTDLVKYSPVPVFVNGKQVSTHPDELKI